MGAYNKHQLLAATLLFDFTKVIHTQYLASTETGRNCGALDYLILQVIEKYSDTHDFLSFGSSCENLGLTINPGLLFQKEGFGARSIA